MTEEKKGAGTGDARLLGASFTGEALATGVGW
jgi:hypothetical protein